MAKTAETKKAYEVKKEEPRKDLKITHYLKPNGAWGMKHEWIDHIKV